MSGLRVLHCLMKVCAFLIKMLLIFFGIGIIKINYTGGTFQIKIGTLQSAIIAAPTTYSWYNTKTVKFSMNLEAGTQIMRLSFIEKPLLNIDYLEFTKNIPTGAVTTGFSDVFNVLQNRQELIINSKTNQPIETLKIYNILGAVVKTSQRPGTNFSVSTQDIHPGVYIIQATSGDHKFSKKIIIQ